LSLQEANENPVFSTMIGNLTYFWYKILIILLM
jgi:hypothetical protein